MAKRWTLKDDQFLVAYADVGVGTDSSWLNHIASHDLGHHGKDAGKKRMAKLVETGLFDKIKAFHDAQTATNDAWGLAFGSQEWKSMVLERQEFEAVYVPSAPSEMEKAS